jgi:hypothetical protein
MPDPQENTPKLWRLLVVGGQIRNIGKTQLVCDIIQAFPKVNWIAGKITPNEAESGAQNGEAIGDAPTEDLCALDWETRADTGTDCARFLAAGAKRSFWLRAKQGLLPDCLPVLTQALRELRIEPDSSGDPDHSRELALIVESNSLPQFVKPSLYFAVLDPDKEDFEESAQNTLVSANALVLRAARADHEAPPAPLWMKVPAKLLQQRPSVLQRRGEPLPRPLESLILQMFDDSPTVSL